MTSSMRHVTNSQVFIDTDDWTDAETEMGLLTWGNTATAPPDVLGLAVGDPPNFPAAAQAAKTSKSQVYSFAKAFLMVLLNCDGLLMVSVAWVMHEVDVWEGAGRCLFATGQGLAAAATTLPQRVAWCVLVVACSVLRFNTCARISVYAWS